MKSNLKFLFEEFKTNRHVILIAVFGSIFQIRGWILNGKLTGDNGDARATLILWEHWSSFYAGDENLRDLNIFFPSKSLLGASDPAFIPGTLYTLFRSLSFSIPMSFQFTILLLSFLGYLGFGFVSLNLFQQKIYQVSFLILIILSYQVNTQSGHPQTYNYLLISWLVVACIWLHKKRSMKLASYLLLLLPWMIAISALYAFIFVWIIAFLSIANYLLFIKGSRENLSSKLQTLVDFWRSRKTSFIFLILLKTGLIWLTLYIYWPYRNESGFSNAFGLYSPRFFDVFNQSTLAQGPIKNFFVFFRLDTSPTFERAMGFSLISLLILLTFQIWSYRSKIRNSPIRFLSIVLFIQLLLIPITDDRGQSLWQIAIKFPIISSVRVPSRIWIFAGFILAYLIVDSIRLMLQRYSENKHVMVAALVFAILIISEYRQPWAFLEKKSVESIMNSSTSKKILEMNCIAFYLAPPPDVSQEVAAEYQIEGMLIATSTGIPSINGYTSIPPKGWPQTGNWGRANLDQVKAWIRSFGEASLSSDYCYIDDQKVNKFEVDRLP
jgi:hypothetical protein